MRLGDGAVEGEAFGSGVGVAKIADVQVRGGLEARPDPADRDDPEGDDEDDRDAEPPAAARAAARARIADPHGPDRVPLVATVGHADIIRTAGPRRASSYTRRPCPRSTSAPTR